MRKSKEEELLFYGGRVEPTAQPRKRGAPKGNLNAAKNGRYSKRMKGVIAALSRVPEVREFFSEMHRRQQREKRKVTRKITKALAEVIASTPNANNPLIAYMLASRRQSDTPPVIGEEKQKQADLAYQKALEEIDAIRQQVREYLKESSEIR